MEGIILLVLILSLDWEMISNSHLTSLTILVDIGSFTLTRIKMSLWMNRDCFYCYTAQDLGLVQHSTIEWEAYIKRLKSRL